MRRIRRRILFAAVILGAIARIGPSPAWAEPGAQGDPRDPGLLAWPPNLKSPHATGDRRGGRTWLEDRGLTVWLDYYGEVFWNTRGGIRTTDRGEYEGLLDLAVAFSTARAGLWKGGSLFFLFQQKHGHGITDTDVGDFQVLSDMETPNFTQVSELWYRQTFLDDRIWLKIGKQDANEDFAGLVYGVEFINSSAGFSPTIPLGTYPDQDLGVLLGLAPMPLLSVNLGVYQGNPDGRRSLKGAFAGLEGPMLIVEPGLRYSVGEKPGDLGIGGWFNGSETDELDKDSPNETTVSEAWGWYLTWSQQFWSREPGGSDGESGIWVFGQYGWAPEDRSEAAHYLGGGVQFAGLIPDRREDAFGVGLFHVRFSGELDLPKSTETVIEFFYKWHLFGFLSLKPDLQYIINPGGTYSDALAIGVRFGLSL